MGADSERRKKEEQTGLLKASLRSHGPLKNLRLSNTTATRQIPPHHRPIPHPSPSEKFELVPQSGSLLATETTFHPRSLVRS